MRFGEVAQFLQVERDCMGLGGVEFRDEGMEQI
jgi:hypothetical protein